MLFSKFFIKTLKEAPKGAILQSHINLVRGSFISQVGSGIYSFLPLGTIVLENIKKIIREEMNKAGANEMIMGFLTPRELWESSQRFDQYGDELGVFNDRKGNDFILSPTNEECITNIVDRFINSYKQLPLNLYQIHLKFRDEMRPRFGLLRAREFVMKDAYSFHEDVHSLNEEFLNMQRAYQNIFDRLGLNYRIIEADSGAIGGSGSREFSVIANNGEDFIVTCQSCEYASNIEAAIRASKISSSPPPKATPNYHKFKTIGTDTIEKIADFFNVDAFYCMKAVVKKIIFKDKEDIAIFFMRGYDEMEDTKAINAVKKIDGEALFLDDAPIEFLKSYGITPGFIGPIYLKSITKSNFIFFDNELMDGNDLICGANEVDYHFVGVNLEEFANLNYADLVKVQENDICAKCGGNLTIKKGIEIGHIFKLGTRYSKKMNATFLDQNGKAQFFEMGCYGIGVSRLLSAILEQKSDEKGCVWDNVAPFKIDIIISNMKDDSQTKVAQKIYDFLKSKNVNVIMDDRAERFGTKISDFELIGFEWALIVGNDLKDNKMELIKRNGLSKTSIDVTNFEIILEMIGE